MANLETYWPEILDVVRQKVPQQTFNTWYLPLQPENSANGTYGVACPNHFFMDWFSEHHLSILNEAGSAYFGKPVTFSLLVEKNLANPAQGILSTILEDVQIDRDPVPFSDQQEESRPRRHESLISAASVLNSGAFNLDLGDPGVASRLTTGVSNLNPDYNFTNFVIGSGTDLVFAAATAVANNPGSHFNPLFIHGGTGLGKTHLMQAIGNEIGRQRGARKICYVTAEHFMNDLIGSIRDNRTQDFKLKYRSVDVILVDDVAFLAGKESTQEEFFHTFNALYDVKKQIVLTSDRSPKEITTLEERLRSRFEWGLITDIQPPNLETRIAILKRKIDVNKIYITEDVITYIADNITDNIRRLEGALIRLLAFASLTGREISLEMASEVLSSFFQGNSTGPVKIADVMSVVANAHDVSVDQLKSKRRTQDLARARQIAMYLSREMTGASLNQIGRSFGGRDHSTVSHACHKIQTEAGSDPRFRGFVRNLQDSIKNKP